MTNSNEQKIIFNENANRFYIGFNENGVSKWTKSNKEAKIFTASEAKKEIVYLKESIMDSKYLEAVPANSEIYS